MKMLVTLLIFAGLVIALFSCKDNIQVTNYKTPAIKDTAEWKFDSGQYSQFMTIVVQFKLNGVLVNDTKILAAFCGKEIRGVSEPYVHAGSKLYNMVVYGNEVGESITFGVFLDREGKSVLCNDSIPFEAGEHLGTPDSPLVLKIN